MNQFPKEPTLKGNKLTVGQKQQLCSGKGTTVGSGLREEDETLALFSKIRLNQFVTSANESDLLNASVTLEPRRIGSWRRSSIDDLLYVDSQKHDYDWLVTPPGTPLINPTNFVEGIPPKLVLRCNSNTRPASIANTSRLPLSTSENGNPVRTARNKNSSTTLPSISSKYPSSNSLNNKNNRTSTINTNTASVSFRPSAPAFHSTMVSSSRTTLSRPSQSVAQRSSTPKRNQHPLVSPRDKQTSQNSRSATPTARLQASSKNFNPRSSVPAEKSNSRSSTPTRHTPATTTPKAALHSSSISNSTGQVSRQRWFTGTRAQPSKKPVVPSHFPIDALPNLRTKLPERALSAGRQQFGRALTIRSNSHYDATFSASSNCGQTASPIASRGRKLESTSSSSNCGQTASPIASRGRKLESTSSSSNCGKTASPITSRGRKLESSSSSNCRQTASPITSRVRKLESSSSKQVKSSGHEVSSFNKSSVAREAAVRRFAKPSSPMDRSEIGHTICKNSIDMALKQTGKRQSVGSIRGVSLIPESIRSTNQRGQLGRSSVPTDLISNKAASYLNKSGMSDSVALDNDNIH